MRRKLVKLAFSATLGFVITFTFSCSSNDDGNGVAPSSSSKAVVPSSSSKAVVPSSSSKAIVQEYCVYTVTTGNGLCGVIEPIGSTYNCTVGTKRDLCPYGYERINLDLLNTCVKACPLRDRPNQPQPGLPRSCETCGGSLSTNSGNGLKSCSVSKKFCGN